MRALTLVAPLLVAIFVPSIARADTDGKVCLAAVDEGQKLRDEGKLGEAREKFLLCASKGCPSVVVKQCDEWVAQVEKDTPTVLFRVRDGAGKELIDVRVLVDGRLVSETIGGQPLPLEPTAHLFRFERADGAFTEERLVIRLGEKSRMIESAFPAAAPAEIPAPPPAPPPPPPSPPPARASFHVPILGWVGGGVFVAGAATTAIFAVRAHRRESELRGSCAPTCSTGERDSIERKVVIANAGMFVGLAGLGLAVVTTILANRHQEPKTGLRLIPAPGGIAGTF